MAHPKRQHSKARTAKRRGDIKIALPSLVECVQCKQLKPPHKACPECGFYKGKQVMAVSKKKEKTENN